MANEINKAFVQQFSNNLIHLAQQRGSRLMSTVMNERVVGKYAHFDRLGSTAAVLRTTRHGETPIIDTPHSRRRVILADYHWGELIDDQDKVRMLIDPKSAYAQAGAWAMGRAMDEVIRDAATGSAASIDSADASSTVALPSTQIVDEDFGSADTNLTLEKLIEAKRILTRNDIMMDEPLYFVYNASAQAALLNLTEVGSADYNSVKALVRGEINTFLGFEFVMYNHLNGTADGTDTDPVKCLAYAKSGIGLGLGQDIKVRMGEDASREFNTRIYASMSLGAVRVEEEKVVEVQVVQSA